MTVYEADHVKALLDWADAAMRTFPHLKMLMHERGAYLLLREQTAQVLGGRETRDAKVPAADHPSGSFNE